MVSKEDLYTERGKKTLTGFVPGGGGQTALSVFETERRFAVLGCILPNIYKFALQSIAQKMSHYE